MCLIGLQQDFKTFYSFSDEIFFAPRIGPLYIKYKFAKLYCFLCQYCRIWSRIRQNDANPTESGSTTLEPSLYWILVPFRTMC
jgi:hypothetical protein